MFCMGMGDKHACILNQYIKHQNNNLWMNHIFIYAMYFHSVPVSIEIGLGCMRSFHFLI